jgi:uncharacterized protein (DUF427 family)
MTRRIHIVLGGETIADTPLAWRILETTHPPTYYLPVSAFAAGALVGSARRSVCEWKGTAQYFSVRGGGHMQTDAGWSYGILTRPTRRCATISLYTLGGWIRAGLTTSVSRRNRAACTAVGSLRI